MSRPTGGHQHRMLEVVVERVALGDRLDGAARQGPEPLGHFRVRRAEDVAKVVREKLRQFPGRNGRDRLHELVPQNVLPLSANRPQESEFSATCGSALGAG